MTYSNNKSQLISSSKCSITVAKKSSSSNSTLDKRAKHNEVEKRSRAIRNTLIDKISAEFSSDQTVEDTLTFSMIRIGDFLVHSNAASIKNQMKFINEKHFLHACGMEQKYHVNYDDTVDNEENESTCTDDNSDYENEPIDIDDNSDNDNDIECSIINILINFKQ